MDINSELVHFSTSEFPPNTVDKMNPAYLHRLDFFRSELGRPVYPSPLVDGWIRTDGSKTSRHFIGECSNERLSDAGDVFPECDLFYALIIAIKCGFTGIGLYFDTSFRGKKKPMMHLDTRPGGTVIWTRIDGKYKTIFPRPNTGFSAFIEKELSNVTE